MDYLWIDYLDNHAWAMRMISTLDDQGTRITNGKKVRWSHIKAILYIQRGFVECASASHDALDKTLLPPSTVKKTMEKGGREEGGEEEEGEGDKKYEFIIIFNFWTLRIRASKRIIYTTNKTFPEQPSSLLPFLPLHRSSLQPPHSSFPAWGI